ncbi:RNA polymerase sigma factor [Aureispira anguillae]|uniref:Sigma-70 family RNA polymerase sigma factor n=1 Tax=Aureispira anguillae TaxID=2864201 RepID=A0A916DY17_9BACT|nr:sigma-70 family RNA polymerase sigma factor [Aureispira anguillae]BDS15596.1 sigma-70 family RNA polymerase sigma factor [Aureispira anguillae]
MANIDPVFLKQLQLGESKAIKQLYTLAYPSCANMILSNNGSNEDARDIFQEALLVFIKKLQNPDFKLTAQPKTYLYAVCRNLWLKQLQKRKKNKATIQIDDPDNMIPLIHVDEIAEKKAIESKHELIGEILTQLKGDCKQLLIAFYFKKMPLKEIAKIMDYSDGFVKVKKKRCMDALKKKVLAAYSTKDMNV